MTFKRSVIWWGFWSWVVLSLWRPIRATDVWWHLASGRYILTHHVIPSVDVFSLTSRGRAWIDYEWFYQILLYLSYQMGSIPGIILFKIGCIVATLYFLGCRLREASVPTLAVLIATATVFSACMAGWSERADLVSLAFLSALLVSLERFRRGSTSPRSLWFWVVLMGVWANTHPAFILGLVIVPLYAVEYVRLRRWTPRQALFWGSCMLLITLVNPYGLHLWSQIIQALTLTTSASDLSEHLPPPWAHMKVFWLAVAMHLLLLVRAVERNLRLPWVAWVISLCFGYAAVRNARYVPFFMIAAFPFAVESAFQGWRSPRLFSLGEGSYASVAISGLFILLALTQIPHVRTGVQSDNVPVAACEFIAAHYPGERFYNDFEFGSYWIWRFAGSPAVFIDGRSPTVEGYAELRQDIRRAQLGPPQGWQDFLNKHRVSAVLIRMPPAEIRQSVVEGYFPRHLWDLVYHDALAILFVRHPIASTSFARMK